MAYIVGLDRNQTRINALNEVHANTKKSVLHPQLDEQYNVGNMKKF